MIVIPTGVAAMAQRGPRWADWVGTLPSTAANLVDLWRLRPDGPGTHGHCSMVLPVRTADGVAAMLKVAFPDEESAGEHLVLRRWGGRGAVRLLRADPRRRALLLERLHVRDLTSVAEHQAIEVVAGLYPLLHLPAMPALGDLSSSVTRWTAELSTLPRDAPIPRRLVEQAVHLGADLSVDRSVPDRVIHTDLHYGNVLAGNVLAGNVLAADRQPWLAIDPKPVNGDPHYELAPMLWNRWPEIAGDVRGGVRRRFWSLVETAGFDEDRARAWVVVRMVHNAMWAVQDRADDPVWLTRCVAIAKAVQQ